MDKVVAAIAGILTAALLWKPFFKDLEGFIKSIKFCITPDMWSLLKDNYFEDMISEFKLGVWLGLSGLAGYGTYLLF